MKVSEIFIDEPVQWGLRGDPYLWREMKDQLEVVEMPASAKDLQKLIKSTYQEVTGHSIHDNKPFVVSRFKHGGMSSGAISPEYWLNKAIPLLIGRHVKPE